MNQRNVYFLTAAVVCLLVLAAVASSDDGPRNLRRPEGRRLPGTGANVPAQTTAQRGAGQPSGSVGSDTCLACHDDIGPAFARTAHGHAQDPRTPAATQGCETCHGPSQAHAQSGDPELIRRFAAISPLDANAVCTTCHNRGVQMHWSGSTHDARNVSCVTCHSVHNARSEVALLKTNTEINTCAQCHKPQAFKEQRVVHMPLREGKMSCSSCHNPHGSTNVRLLRVGNWINEACISCHAEKRGPFLWEHAAGRESCITCHDPHGGSNDRMLVAKLPMLCQRCHIGTRHPSTLYDNTVRQTSNRLFGRACVNCHANIHGSNHPAGSTFLR